jgi:nucleoside-diphosphate-sugar epimerase
LPGVSGARVLLLGGSGFMGARTARMLAKAGHEVWTLTRGSRPVPSIAHALHGDRRDPAVLAAVLEGRRFEFTVDFCAFDATDVECLLRVPHAALGRYVLISSGQVYLVTEAPRTPYREEDSAFPLRPEPLEHSRDHAQWRYGVGKRRAEGAVLALRATHGMRATVLRLPIVHGEGDPTLRLWAYLERILDGGPLLLPDGGAHPTRYLHAGDVAEVLRTLLESEPPPEPLYNLAQPEVVTLREFLERAARTAGVEPRFVPISGDEATSAGLDPGFSPLSGPWSSVLDPARAARQWGFAATPLDQWLPAVVRWHLDHRPTHSHAGYATRALERRFAASRTVGTR